MKTKVLIGLSFIAILLCWVAFSTLDRGIRDVQLMKYGQIIEGVVVTTTQGVCFRRHNSVAAKYQGRIFKVNISPQECMNSTFAIGADIRFFFDEKRNRAIRENHAPLGIILGGVFFALCAIGVVALIIVILLQKEKSNLSMVKALKQNKKELKGKKRNR